MKLELKTQNDDNYKSFFAFLFMFIIISFLIILSNVSIKLGRISRNYEVNYLCKLLIFEKSAINFKKLSNLTNQSSKQKIWDLCREIVK